MENSVQWILLLIGCIVIAGIIWDSKKNKNKEKKSQKLNARSEPSEFFDEELLLDDFNRDADRKPESSDILLLYVIAKQNYFSGGELLEAFSEARLYYGDMQIFHRYENLDGTGNLVFSVASAVEPGYFELSKMENFETPAITLFFQLKKPNQSIAAFESMLRNAKQLAIRLQGELKDENRYFLTPEKIEQYRARARRGERSNSSLRVYASG